MCQPFVYVPPSHHVIDASFHYLVVGDRLLPSRRATRAEVEDDAAAISDALKKLMAETTRAELERCCKLLCLFCDGIATFAGDRTPNRAIFHPSYGWFHFNGTACITSPPCGGALLRGMPRD